jgi:UDP-perosamine 4-acetyltransferase
VPARVLIFGGGGHAKVVIESLRAADPDVDLAIIDDDPGKLSSEILGVPVVGGRGWLESNWPEAPVAMGLGSNRARVDFAEWLRQQNRKITSVIHPSAVVSPSATVMEGAFLAPACVINAETTVGALSIINTGATVDHDCIIGEGVHIAPGAHLCGNVTVGDRALVGAGATIVPGLRIGADAIVGAGATVVRDVPDRVRVAGTPAKPLGSVRPQAIASE